ncbi:MAG: hypothetical protein JXB60_09530, partial [Candidatus Cloacimonetes bacterium]|nr:hypothetical protein [Candidatus Cloacimonadota bacterium]
LVFLAGWVVQLLWNATISVIFTVSTISYWQSLMLILLCKILFGSHYRVHKQHREIMKYHQKPDARNEKEEEKD